MIGVVRWVHDADRDTAAHRCERGPAPPEHSTALENTIPGKNDANLLVATWNVRAFGDLTEKWKARP